MIKEILDKIIKADYRKSLNDWQQYATQQDKKGLQIINEIYRTKGNKLVTYKLPQEKIMYETQLSFLSNQKNVNSLQEAQEKFRRKQMTTSYKFFHSGLSAPKNRTQLTIFQFKSLQKMDLSRPFTTMTVQFIDNWLELKDSVTYQRFVLACLRSLNSKVHLSDSNISEMKTKYDWKNDWDLAKPVRIDKVGQDLNLYKPNIQAIKRQQQKQSKLKKRLKQLQGTEFAKQMKIFKDFKIN